VTIRAAFVLFRAHPANPFGYMGRIRLPDGQFFRIEANAVAERDGIKKHFEGILVPVDVKQGDLLSSPRDEDAALPFDDALPEGL